jgi:hypothetical protein
MPLQNYPDTIFDSLDPAVNPGITGLFVPGTTQGGRLMSSAPHIDGVVSVDAGQLDKDSANLVLTRNGVGDWSLNRTAGGAETYNCRINLSELIARLGEKYNFGAGFNSAKQPNPGPKGIMVTDFFAIYRVGVVDLTTATLRLGKSVFANNVALAQTDIVAATAIPKTAAGDGTGPYVSVVPVPAGSQVFMTDDTAQWEVEAQFVMANTGTLRVYGVGCHINFNFN